MSSLRPPVLVVIAAMSAVTYVTKAGGFWALDRIEIDGRLEAGLEALPGAIVLSIVSVELLRGGPAEWAAAAVVALLVRKTDSILLGLVGGTGVVLAVRLLGAG